MLARSRLGQRKTAVDARQAGFVGFSGVAMGADGIFDDSRQLLPKGLFAGSNVKKIEGQTVVHRREKMSLPKFDLALPQRAADRRGQTAIIPCRDREHCRGAIADDCRFWPNCAATSREAYQM